MKNIFSLLAGSALCLAFLQPTAQAQTVSGSYAVGCTAYTQEQSNWCWAGVTRMVDWTYSSTTPPAQCTIVTAANNSCDGIFNTCCGNLDGGRASACTSPGASNVTNSMYGCGGSLEWLIENYAVGCTGYGNAFTYADVSNNLYYNKEMAARWGWSSGGGHFLAIYGCYKLTSGSTVTNYVQYADPGNGSKNTTTYTNFKSNSSHTWTHTLRMDGAAYHKREVGPVAETELSAAGSLQVYPNPSDGELNLKRSGDLTGDVQISIVNTLGQEVHRSTLGQDQLETTLHLKGELAAGIYLVNLLHNEELRTEKLIIR